MYKITYAPKAKEDLKKLKQSDPSYFNKAVILLQEIAIHPTTGTGHPEHLKEESENLWSRRISKKHRLVYSVFETEILVHILSAYGHYDDK